MKTIKNIVYIIFSLLSIILLIFISILLKIKKQKKEKIIFGTTPILNNKYWSNALKEIGINSETFMRTYFDNINKKDD